MGIGTEAMLLYAQILTEPAFTRGNSVCELGSQDMQCDGHWWNPAREYYEGLGLSYVCIDIDGRHGALRLDLNTAKWSDIGQQFDVVTNHGTTEHCFDQYNCMKLMHDLTKVGGLIIHVVPSHPWALQDDSFYYYSRSLFEDLADANEYEKVKCEYVEGKHGNMVSVVFRRRTDELFKAPVQKVYQLREGPVIVPPTAELGVSAGE